MRALLLALVCLACACQPIGSVPPSPTARVVTVSAVFSTLTPLPTIAITVTSAPTVTVQPTPEPALRSFHPVPREVESINVLAAVCGSRATTWNVYEWGMVQVYDADADARCRAGGVL